MNAPNPNTAISVRHQPMNPTLRWFFAANIVVGVLAATLGLWALIATVLFVVARLLLVIVQS